MASKGKFPLNGLRVCIDQMKDGKISGFFCSPLQEECIAFHGFEEFILKADYLFDRHGYPQSYVTGRTFFEEPQDVNHYHGLPQRLLSDEEVCSFEGKLLTCDVVVESRKEAAWQGKLGVASEKSRYHFDNVLDIVKILERLQGHWQ